MSKPTYTAITELVSTDAVSATVTNVPLGELATLAEDIINYLSDSTTLSDYGITDGIDTSTTGQLIQSSLFVGATLEDNPLVEIATNTSNAYLNFHTSASTYNSYDVQFEISGGGTSSGAGDLTITSETNTLLGDTYLESAQSGTGALASPMLQFSGWSGAHTNAYQAYVGTAGNLLLTPSSPHTGTGYVVIDNSGNFGLSVVGSGSAADSPSLKLTSWDGTSTSYTSELYTDSSGILQISAGSLNGALTASFQGLSLEATSGTTTLSAEYPSSGAAVLQLGSSGNASTTAPVFQNFMSSSAATTASGRWYDGSGTFTAWNSEYNSGAPTFKSYKNTLDDGTGAATFAGEVTASSFSGDGSNLTNIPAGAWGSITGTLSNQTDLMDEFALYGALASANTWTTLQTIQATGNNVSGLAIIASAAGATGNEQANIWLETVSTPTTSNPQFGWTLASPHPLVSTFNWYDGTNEPNAFYSEYNSGAPTFHTYNNTLDDGSGVATFAAAVGAAHFSASSSDATFYASNTTGSGEARVYFSTTDFSPTSSAPDFKMGIFTGSNATLFEAQFDGSSFVTAFASQYNSGAPNFTTYQNTLDDGSGNMTVQGFIELRQETPVYFYNGGSFPAISMNNTGQQYFGTIGSVATGTWGLGYTTTYNTNGSSALEWSASRINLNLQTYANANFLFTTTFEVGTQRSGSAGNSPIGEWVAWTGSTTTVAEIYCDTAGNGWLTGSTGNWKVGSNLTVTDTCYATSFSGSSSSTHTLWQFTNELDLCQGMNNATLYINYRGTNTAISTYRMSDGQGAGGTAKVEGSSFQIASDQRLKDNIRDIDVSSLFGKFHLREFDWNDSGRNGERSGEHDWGVIVQEVEPICPYIVNWSEEDEYGSVDYGKLGTIWGAINQDRIQKLEARIAELEARP